MYRQVALEAVLEGGHLDQTVVVAKAFGTYAPWDFQSYQESEGVGGAGAACAGSAGETSREIGWPLVVVGRLKGAVGMAIVGALDQMGTGCST